MRLGRSFPRSALGALVALLLSMLCTGAQTVRAEPERRLVVLHRGDDQVDPTLRREIDALVLAETTRAGGFSSAYASPVPFEDVELAAGCSATEEACLPRIAATLDADWLMVRDLARDSAGNVQLSLTMHDGTKNGEVRRAVSQVGDLPPDQVVPQLVDSLYPGNARRRDAPARGGWNPRSTGAVIGWSSLGLASALLVGGVIAGVRSQRAHDAYAGARFEDMEAVDRGHEQLDTARSRARVANGLFIGSAVAAAAGASSLLVSYLRTRRVERPSVGVSVAPTPAGLSLAVEGSWRGGL